jgi:hypothetical protein
VPRTRIDYVLATVEPIDHTLIWLVYPRYSNRHFQADALEKLGELHASGVLTDAEFAEKKTKLLKELWNAFQNDRHVRAPGPRRGGCRGH